MKEAIATRVGRIVSGSAHALVDALENTAPELVMEEAIREIDGAIDEVRATLGHVAANRHLASTRLMEENRRHEELAEQLATAVETRRDDLAEAAITRQLDIEDQIPVLERAIADAAEEIRELEGYVMALKAKRREMREDLKRLVIARGHTAEASSNGGTVAASSPPGAVERRVERAESAFDRILEKQTGLPGSASSPDREAAAKLAELEELSRQDRIRERLAAAKSRLPA